MLTKRMCAVLPSLSVDQRLVLGSRVSRFWIIWTKKSLIRSGNNILQWSFQLQMIWQGFVDREGERLCKDLITFSEMVQGEALTFPSLKRFCFGWRRATRFWLKCYVHPSLQGVSTFGESPAGLRGTGRVPYWLSESARAGLIPPIWLLVLVNCLLLLCWPLSE